MLLFTMWLYMLIGVITILAYCLHSHFRRIRPDLIHIKNLQSSAEFYYGEFEKGSSDADSTLKDLNRLLSYAAHGKYSDVFLNRTNVSVTAVILTHISKVEKTREQQR